MHARSKTKHSRCYPMAPAMESRSVARWPAKRAPLSALKRWWLMDWSAVENPSFLRIASEPAIASLASSEKASTATSRVVLTRMRPSSSAVSSVSYSKIRSHRRLDGGQSRAEHSLHIDLNLQNAGVVHDSAMTHCHRLDVFFRWIVKEGQPMMAASWPAARASVVGRGDQGSGQCCTARHGAARPGLGDARAPQCAQQVLCRAAFIGTPVVHLCGTGTVGDPALVSRRPCPSGRVVAGTASSRLGPTVGAQGFDPENAYLDSYSIQ